MLAAAATRLRSRAAIFRLRLIEPQRIVGTVRRGLRLELQSSLFLSFIYFLSFSLRDVVPQRRSLRA